MESQMHRQTSQKPAAAPASEQTRSHQLLALRLPKMLALAVMLFAVSAYAIQEKQEAPKPDGPDKYAPLMEEFLNLESKLEQGVTFPAPRTQSKLMPLLPASTQIFASLPNFGAAVGQADQIFHQQLQERKVLADWWNTQAMAGMIVEEALAKVQQFSGYLGDGIVVARTIDPPHETVVLPAASPRPTSPVSSLPAKRSCQSQAPDNQHPIRCGNVVRKCGPYIQRSATGRCLLACCACPGWRPGFCLPRSGLSYSVRAQESSADLR